MVEFIGEELVGLGIDLKTRKWNLIYIYLHRVKACVDMIRTYLNMDAELKQQ